MDGLSVVPFAEIQSLKREMSLESHKVKFYFPNPNKLVTQSGKGAAEVNDETWGFHRLPSFGHYNDIRAEMTARDLLNTCVNFDAE